MHAIIQLKQVKFIVSLITKCTVNNYQKQVKLADIVILFIQGKRTPKQTLPSDNAKSKVNVKMTSNVYITMTLYYGNEMRHSCIAGNKMIKHMIEISKAKHFKVKCKYIIIIITKLLLEKRYSY